MSERTTTVLGGDTLSGIALREMGSASLWPRLFARNEAAIMREIDRRDVGRLVRRVGRDMHPEDWIFPSMKLVIPHVARA